MLCRLHDGVFRCLRTCRNAVVSPNSFIGNTIGLSGRNESHIVVLVICFTGDIVLVVCFKDRFGYNGDSR